MLIAFLTERGKRRFSSFSTNLAIFSVNGFQHWMLPICHACERRPRIDSCVTIFNKTAGKWPYFCKLRGGFRFANACPQEASPLLLQGQRSNYTNADLHLLLKTAVVLGYGLSLTPRPQQPPRSRRPRRSPRPPPPRRRALPRPRSRRSCPPARRPWHRSHDRC